MWLWVAAVRLYFFKMYSFWFNPIRHHFSLLVLRIAYLDRRLIFDFYISSFQVKICFKTPGHSTLFQISISVQKIFFFFFSFEKATNFGSHEPFLLKCDVQVQGLLVLDSVQCVVKCLIADELMNCAKQVRSTRASLKV